MRKVLGARFLFSLSLVAAVGVWAACGGSDAQDVMSNDAGVDSGTNRDSGEGEDLDSGTNEKKDTGADTGPGKVYDAGQPNVVDGGDVVEGGIPCVVGGELEVEPNDLPAVANTLSPTRCGVLVAHDGGADGGDRDWLTFQLADASTEFFVQYAGEVKVFVETDGQAPVDITANPPPKLKFVKGQPYLVEVRPKTDKTQTWRVTLFQE